MNGQSHFITLRLLKGFALTISHTRVPVCTSTQRLLAFLALQDIPRSRAYVAGILWPDVTTARANANLRSSLWRATRTGHSIIEASPQEMAISKDISVDLHEAVRHAHRLLDNSRPCDDILTMRTLADLSADLLPEWPENDWMLIEQEQYHQLRLYALEAMTERLTAARRHGEAVAAGLAAVRAEPLRESAHRVLVKAHLAMRQQGRGNAPVRTVPLCPAGRTGPGALRLAERSSAVPRRTQCAATDPGQYPAQRCDFEKISGENLTTTAAGKETEWAGTVTAMWPSPP